MAQETTDSSNSDDARRKRRIRFRIFGALLTVLLIVGGVYWLLTRNHETTDDAFIEADIIPIAPRIDGVISQLHFSDNQWVDKGALLLEIDPRDAEVDLASAQANLDAALAQRQAAEADLSLSHLTTDAAIDEARNAVEQAKRQVAEARQQAKAVSADSVRSVEDVKRYEELYKTRTASKQRLEQAIADSRSASARWRAAQLAATAAESQVMQAQAKLDDAQGAPQRVAGKLAQLATATAQVEQAAAALNGAKLTLSYTKIFAPQAGRMARRAVQAGAVVQKNQTLAALVADPPWVIGNFKETQLARMRPGQAVTIKVDAFPDHPFKGHVDSIQPGSGSRFSLLPPENATGNYVKIVQRIPVKIVFDSVSDAMVHLLAPGMSVAPDVDVGTVPDLK